MGGEVSNTKEHKREKTAAYKGEEGAKMGLKVDEYNDHSFCLFGNLPRLNSSSF